MATSATYHRPHKPILAILLGFSVILIVRSQYAPNPNLKPAQDALAAAKREEKSAMSAYNKLLNNQKGKVSKLNAQFRKNTNSFKSLNKKFTALDTSVKGLKDKVDQILHDDDHVAIDPDDLKKLHDDIGVIAKSVGNSTKRVAKLKSVNKVWAQNFKVVKAALQKLGQPV